jgi:hypothetical protein
VSQAREGTTTNNPPQPLVANAVAVYTKAMGFSPDRVKVSYQQLKDKKGNIFAVACDSVTATPLLMADKDAKTGEWMWSEATLKKLADKIGMKIGIRLDPRNRIFRQMNSMRVRRILSGKTASRKKVKLTLAGPTGKLILP